MNQEQLNAIKERVAKATQGPWEYDEEDRGIWNKGALNYLGTVKLPNKDANFIAHSREDVPALIAEVERLHKALEKVMEVEAPIMEGTKGWETRSYEIARKALGGEAYE